jgi:hypothetical protein
MKPSKLLFIVMGGFLLGSFYSCKKYLEEKPLSYYDPGSVFASIDNAQLAMNGCYFDILNLWSVDYAHIGENGTDVSVFPGEDPVGDVENYSLTSSNGYAQEIWQNLFNGIYRCNQVIDRVGEMTAGTEDQRAALIGEARTLRAIHYFDLVNFYDNPPLVLHETLGYNDSVFVSNSDPKSVFMQIVDDLKYGEKYAPDPSSANLSQANKGVAMALLAKAYLFMGSAYWRDKIFGSGSPEIDGQSVWKLAAEKADEVINSGWYSLQTTNSSRPDLDYAKNFLQTQQPSCREIIMDFHFNTTVWQPTKFGQWVAPLALPSGWDPRNSKYFYHEEEGWVKPVGQFLMSFHDDDIRFQWDAMPVVFHPGAAEPIEIHPVEDWYSGKWRSEAVIEWGGNMAPTYLRLADMYLIKAEALNELNDEPTAEAYQALNAVRERAHVPDIDADYLNAPNPHPNPDLFWGMQTGRYLADGTDAQYPGRHEYYTSGLISYPLLKDKFRAAVMSERAWEFCFERQRWMDVKRTKMLEEIIKPDRFRQVLGLELLPNHVSDDPYKKTYSNFTDAELQLNPLNGGVGAYNKMVNSFDPARNYRLPIPQSELDANKNLKQNEGY